MLAKPMIFQTPQVAKLLRANRFTLNRLMLRCKIETAFGNRGRGSRLIFVVEDVATLSLAYWLFRAGLRTRAIKDALANEQLTKLLKKLVSAEAIKAEGERTKFLVSWRAVRPRVSQRVALEDNLAGLAQALAEPEGLGFVVIPIGRLLTDLAGSMQKQSLGGS
jgi:hypothetical protein